MRRSSGMIGAMGVAFLLAGGIALAVNVSKVVGWVSLLLRERPW